jgi:hypothetical protein
MPPPDPSKDPAREERSPSVQADFDANRVQEVLDKTLTSPDGKRVLAVYHKAGDLPSEFRLDMYTTDGRILKKVTSDTMAVHFPDTIRWSPDSSTVAFVAMIRGASVDETANEPANDPEVSVAQPDVNANSTPASDANANTDVTSDANAVAPGPTLVVPTGILTFRTEQIYICNADGDGAKAITQNEGLIYFYYVWSPDSTMLAAVAAKSIEWKYLNDRADLAGEIFVPVGRPRVIEKNGRERRLDDGKDRMRVRKSGPGLRRGGNGADAGGDTASQPPAAVVTSIRSRSGGKARRQRPARRECCAGEYKY